MPGVAGRNKTDRVVALLGLTCLEGRQTMKQMKTDKQRHTAQCQGETLAAQEVKTGKEAKGESSEGVWKGLL